MIRPVIKTHEVIRIGDHPGAPKAQVIRVYPEEEKENFLCGDMEVIYNQNGLKAVKEDVIWDGEKWTFRTSGPDGIVVGNLKDYPEIG